MNNSTNVLVSARVFDRQVGGNTRYVRAIYERIRDEGVSFTWARPALDIKHGGVRSAVYAGLEGAVWPFRRPSVIHYPADTGAIVRTKTPIVGTIHGLATLHIPNVRKSHADAMWRGRVRQLAKLSDKIITVSNTSARDIASFEPSAADRIEVIHHGIDHEKFSTTPIADFASLQSRLSVPNDYFLYVGNLDPRKNVIELVSAAAIAFQSTGVPLVVAGAPAWDSAEIVEAVNATEGVIYVGRVSDEDVVTLMQNTLAFCFPSAYEGFGFPVLEAMACGAPVICSDRGSLGEVAGEAALIVQDIGREAIANAMTKMAGDSVLRERLSSLGIQNAAKFDWQESARRHAEIFREVSS